MSSVLGHQVPGGPLVSTKSNYSQLPRLPPQLGGTRGHSFFFHLLSHLRKEMAAGDSARPQACSGGGADAVGGLKRY